MTMSGDEAAVVRSAILIALQIPKVHPRMVIRAVGSLVPICSISYEADVQVTSVGRGISVGLEAVEGVGAGGTAVLGVKRVWSATGFRERAFSVRVDGDAAGTTDGIGCGAVDGDVCCVASFCCGGRARVSWCYAKIAAGHDV